MSKEINREDILMALSRVVSPETKKDIVSSGHVLHAETGAGGIEIRVKMHNPAMHARKAMEQAIRHHLDLAFGADVAAKIGIEAEGPEQKEEVVDKHIPGVDRVVAIASGKGGVGKSTVTANLAAGLAKAGFRVGLIDADIYGPSMPMMFGVADAKPAVTEQDGKKYMMPVESHGVKLLSIGFFTEGDQAVAWRGPMASSALKQMFNEAWWGELDYLLIDLPPGTGDIHLTLVQDAPLDGSIIVSTPQPVALADARKGIAMFRMPAINIPVLGIVENMSWFTPKEHPDEKYYIFGKEGAKQLAEDQNIPLLGQIPLVQGIRESGDAGMPALLGTDPVTVNAFEELVLKVKDSIHEMAGPAGA